MIKKDLVKVKSIQTKKRFHRSKRVAVRNRYTGRFTAVSIREMLSLILLLTRGPRRTITHQLAEHEDCIKGEQKICSQISYTTCINCDALGVSGSSCYKILKTNERSPKHNPCK